MGHCFQQAVERCPHPVTLTFCTFHSLVNRWIISYSVSLAAKELDMLIGGQLDGRRALGREGGSEPQWSDVGPLHCDHGRSAGRLLPAPAACAHWQEHLQGSRSSLNVQVPSDIAP